MPLVVPGINSTMGDKSEWANKLMGKKISDSGSDELVCPGILEQVDVMNTDRAFYQSFAKKDLPKTHRVLGPDDMKSMDHNPDRLNVHVDHDGTVRDVTYG